MPYDIPRPTGYRIQPFKLQDDEALVAAMANQLLKARLAEARAAAGGGGGGGRGKSGGKEKGAWVRKFDPKTGRYERVWVEGSTGEERKGTVHGEDFNKTADWISSSPDAQRLLGVLRNGSASNKAKQKALAEFRSLKSSGELEGLDPSAVDEAVERAAKPYKADVEAEKKEIAESGSGLLTNIRVGLERLGTFIGTIGDDAETTLEKRRKSLEKQQEIRESDPYTREQMRREAEGEGLWERSDGAAGVAANAAGALLSDPSALPVAGGALLGGIVGGPAGAAAGAALAGAGGAASGDTYLGERLVQDDRLSDAERARAYEEGKLSEMGINAAVNAVPFGGAAGLRAGRTALAAAGRGALGRQAAELATDFGRSSAWRTAADTASYAERFGGLAGDAAEQAVAQAARRPIAADLVRQSERGVAGALKYNVLPEAAMASGLNAGAMAGSNVHYNELTGQDDSVMQNVPEAAAMGLLFGIPYGIGTGIGARRRAALGVPPERRLADNQRALDKLAQVESSRSYNEAYGISDEAPAEGKSKASKPSDAETQAEFRQAAQNAAAAPAAAPAEPSSAPSPVAERGPADMPSTPKGFVDLFRKDASPDEIRDTLSKNGLTPDGARRWMEGKFPDALQTNEAGFRDLYDRIPTEVMNRATTRPGAEGSAYDAANDFSMDGRSPASPEAVRPQSERNPASADLVEFSDAERVRLERLDRADAWPQSVVDGWSRDPALQSALAEYREAFGALTAGGAAEGRQAQARVDAAAAKYKNVIRQLMLRDEDLRDPGRAAYGAGQGVKPEARNGEGRLQGAGAGAPVRGAGLAGEGRTGQADTGAGRPLGTDTQSYAGANARGVSPQAGVRDTQDTGGGLGGGSRGSASPAEDTSGLFGASGDRLVPGGERAVRERGAGDAAQVRADADTLAGGDGHPAEPGAGSASARGRAEAALTVSGRGAEYDLRNRLALAGDDRLLNAGVAAKAEQLAKLGLGREEVARFMDAFARHEDPFFTLADERALGFDPALRRDLGLTPASKSNFTPSMKKGIMRLADYYGIPPVTARAVSDFGPDAYGRDVISAINGRFAELRAADVRLTDSAFGELDALRDRPVGSPDWLDAASRVLNRALSETEGRVDLNGEDAMGARFFMENFPEKWRDVELGSKPKPIEVADIADRLDHRDTLGRTAERERNGDPIC